MDLGFIKTVKIDHLVVTSLCTRASSIWRNIHIDFKAPSKIVQFISISPFLHISRGLFRPQRKAYKRANSFLGKRACPDLVLEWVFRFYRFDPYVRRTQYEGRTF